MSSYTQPRGSASSALACLALACAAAPARAHISLERGGSHQSRYGEEQIKEGPCGLAGGTRGEHVYTYEPGQTITVRFSEFVPHPGYFRFAFDADGDDDFEDPASIDPLDPARGCPAVGLPEEQGPRDQCMGSDFYNNAAVLPGMDNLAPHVSAPDGTMYEFEVQLPDVECDNCTLQLIQVMEDQVHGPYNVEVAGAFDVGDIYYQCIDLVLTRGSAAAGSGSGAMAGTSGMPAAGAGAAAPTKASDGGGCRVMHVGAARVDGDDVVWLLVALGLAGSRLRRRQLCCPRR